MMNEEREEIRAHTEENKRELEEDEPGTEAEELKLLRSYRDYIHAAIENAYKHTWETLVRKTLNEYRQLHADSKLSLYNHLIAAEIIKAREVYEYSVRSGEIRMSLPMTYEFHSAIERYRKS